MTHDSNCSDTSFIPPQPGCEQAREFSHRVHGLMDGKAKDEATVARALDGMDAMLDTIAAGLYSLASMLVGEGEDGVRLVEKAIATAEVPACEDKTGPRKSGRRALIEAALELIAARAPGSLAAPAVVAPAGGCIEDDDLESAGVTKNDLERMFRGPDRDRVRAWLEKLPTEVRIVFVLRAVAGFTASETAGLLAAYGGPKAAAWTVEAVRSVFRQGLCSLASQLIHAATQA